jgi:hypothetical protein
MTQPSAMDRAECGISEPSQIHTADFRPESAAGGKNRRYAVRRFHLYRPKPQLALE